MRTWATSEVADPDRMDVHRVPGPLAQLLRPGRAVHRARQQRDEWLLRPRPLGARYPDAGPRDDGGDHRVASVDLRRVLADQPGRAAGLDAARHRGPHVVEDGRPDLHPRGEL